MKTLSAFSKRCLCQRVTGTYWTPLSSAFREATPPHKRRPACPRQQLRLRPRCQATSATLQEAPTEGNKSDCRTSSVIRERNLDEPQRRFSCFMMSLITSSSNDIQPNRHAIDGDRLTVHRSPGIMNPGLMMTYQLGINERSNARGPYRQRALRSARSRFRATARAGLQRMCVGMFALRHACPKETGDVNNVERRYRGRVSTLTS